jgi:NADH:ubiquinone oxidoreductase subunit
MSANRVPDDKASQPRQKESLAALGGWRMLLRNPGVVLHTMRHGGFIGKDGFGNRYYEELGITRPDGRRRRWVYYPLGGREASLVPPEWHAWLHYVTDEPVPDTGLPWQKPYLPNLTGTPAAYRPPGHDYISGTRDFRPAQYEAWTPES